MLFTTFSCSGCGRSPQQIRGIVKAADKANLTPEEYIWKNEGSLNPISGKFLCDPCYVDSGMLPTTDGSRWQISS